MEEDNFFMAIQNPRDFRRELLGTSKNVIKLMQRYDKIKQIREDKVRLMQDFSTSMAEIGMIVGKLEKTIPQTKLRKLEKKLQDTNLPVLKQTKPVESEDVTKLQKELENIEKSLERLG